MEDIVLNHYQKNNMILLQKLSLTKQQSIDDILLCNEKTKSYGLTLTRKQILSLVENQQNVLKQTKRIEFNGNVVQLLINALYDSPFVIQDNYEEILHSFMELFYELKNETWDIIDDQKLIDFMKKSFQETCQGSLDIFNDELSRFIQHIHHGGKIDDYHSPMEKHDGLY